MLMSMAHLIGFVLTGTRLHSHLLNTYQGFESFAIVVQMSALPTAHNNNKPEVGVDAGPAQNHKAIHTTPATLGAGNA
jgi:hypothetical protein